MLQPRLFNHGCEMAGARNSFEKWTWILFAVLLSTTLVTCQDLNNESIEATRIKREGVPENRDLTVLLINDQKKNDYSKIGRYLSVKPLIGLLTSTARTFIQDGVTTEFATQILGTTLDNGRIYAQVLTKSSLILYNKPSNVDDPVEVSPTRIHSAFDGEWSVKQDLGFIDPDNFVLKNTDYIAPSSKMELVYPSKSVQDNVKYWSPPSASDNQIDNQIFEEPTGRRIQPMKEIPRYVQNEAFNFLDGPLLDGDKKFERLVQPSILENVNLLHRQNKGLEPVTEPISIDTRIKEELNVSNIVKVKPNYDLPTFTIKNEFSPIFYYIDNVESRNPQQQIAQQTKLPKKLFGQKSEQRAKKTFTYVGFADFTTVVGDSVIIFTPNTEINRPQNPDEVNVFPSAKRVDKLATKITFLASDIPVATATYKAHDIITPTKITTAKSNENDSAHKLLFNNEEELEKVHYEVSNRNHENVNIHYNHGFDLNLDVIQPSESVIPVTENTRYGMGELDVLPIQEYKSKATDPLGVIKASSSVSLTEIGKESVVTENDMESLFTNSEEESDNVASEVTEKSQELDEITPGLESEEIITTTESGHSDESVEEDFETTTETKHDINANLVCSDGYETLSTMTTAYKTLTYLTTYFIPVESTKTTTSIKSDVIVESNVGYLTNVVCKTKINIEPTAILGAEIKSSIASSLEEVSNSSEELMNRFNLQSQEVTEKSSPTTESSEEILENLKEKVLSDENKAVIEDKSVESSVEKANTNSTTTTTTENSSTTHDRVEVSHSTEHSTTTTENLDSNEESQEVHDNRENEVDIIYKTLYTTYTYFTTFFGDKTSSVASHKSVVTNIITSSIDLSKLDPSLLGAFDNDEIAPPNVGIGRPTESFAINSIIDLVKNKDVIESVEIDNRYSAQTPTPSLGDDIISSIKPDAVKTYYTTYTFFTTIYVGTDANVCSRSEVYTNYVGPDELIPTKVNHLSVENTQRPQFDFRNCKQIKIEPKVNQQESSSMETSVSMEENSNVSTEDSKEASPQPAPVEVDMLFSVDSNPLNTENTYVTDVKSSSSKGERQYLENNHVLDDQISSESNIGEEIMPSPTLLLQTSYTTFTYFTTIYIGKDSSKVNSRLETITNVVTETITPKKEMEEENNLPITYYTTFTYWTTLYKDKSTTITSREEIVSNVVTPGVQVAPTINPIDTTPIEVEGDLPPKELEVELKPSVIGDNLEQDDGKATFYTTYTYFTTFYVGNTSHIRSNVETVTTIVENTKLIDDNIIGRKVQSGGDKNLIQDEKQKQAIAPSVLKQEIEPTKLPDLGLPTPTAIVGTYIDNLYAEVKPEDDKKPKEEKEKQILFSQVAVISGDSTIITNDNNSVTTEKIESNSNLLSSTEGSLISPTPEVIESSVAEPESTTESKEEGEEDEDSSNTRKKSRLTFTTKKPTFTPVIRPFSSRNRPTFSPKRVPALSSATIISRNDFTPTITATPTLKSVRASGFAPNRKQAAAPASAVPSKRFNGRSSVSNLPVNPQSVSRSSGFARSSIQPTSRRTGFRSSSLRVNSLDYASRSGPRVIRPTASSRLRGGRQSASISFPPADQNESETSATQQQEENATEPLEEVTEAPVRTTNNPLLRFRRPPVARQPGTAITPRSTTPPARRITTRGRVTTTTRRSVRTTTNALLTLRRQRPNSLFPRRNLFKQPDPEPEEEIKENEQEVDDNEETLETDGIDDDNDYDSSDRKEQQVASPSTPAPKSNPNKVQIKPFAFRKRTKRQVDYGSRKYSNFRRPSLKSQTTRKPEPEPETEPPTTTTRSRIGGRYSSRLSGNSRTTTAATAPKVSSRQPFIIRGGSATTTSITPAYRRGKSRVPSRTTTISSRPKAPRLSSDRRASSRTTARSRTRTTTSRASSRQRNSHENFSGERQHFHNPLNDGKVTVTFQIPTEVTIPVVNGKITEYKNVLTAKPRIETLLRNQVSTSLGPLGIQQLVLASESTEIDANGATKIIRYILHETPTSTVIFTPTTIRGRKTSYSHILPSTIINVEAVTQTITPEINANVPLANLLLSQLLLGNQQPNINPLLALQGQALLPQQQQVVPTPVTEYKTRTTTYVTTVTDKRETVLPITFRGKAILTTIIDPTITVITATEFLTDTIVTTPTAVAQPQQFNSLLLPLLLQQQQQQQQQQLLPIQTANPLLGLAPDLNLVQNNNLLGDIYSNSPKPNILSELNSNEDFSEDEEEESYDDVPPPPPPPSRSRNKPKAAKPAPPKQTSIVTLYVSGRHPGEFSTVLSTVITDDTQTVRKREAIYYDDIKVLPSLLPSVDEILSSQLDLIPENTVISDSEKLLEDTFYESQVGTKSLESILGDVSKHVINDSAAPTYIVKLADPSSSVRDTEQNTVDDVS